MTRARNVFVADRWTRPSSSPIGVYGPTMKISSSPMTRGGSSRLHSTPASQNRGNGSDPRASFQASGVPRSISTPSVIAPDSTDTTSGSSAPGTDSAVVIWPQDRWASRVITGPSRAIQMTAAPVSEATPLAERTVRRRADPATWAGGLAAQLTLHGRGNRAGIAGDRPGDQREPSLLVLGQARRGQRVLNERCAGRGGLADDGDVDHLRRARLGRLGAARRGDGHRRLGVLVRQRGIAQVNGGGRVDVRQVQLDRLGDECARGVELAGLERGVQRGLGVDL